MTYGVHNTCADVVPAKRIGNNFHSLCRCKHTYTWSALYPVYHIETYRITGLHNIDTNVFANSINLLLHKIWWYMVDALHPESVLCCQCSRSRHCIVSMRCNDFLVCFQSAIVAVLAHWFCGWGGRKHAYAPPELSEPAITRIRFEVMVG